MPKVVDHDQRRDEIAVFAMHAVAKHGLGDVKLEHVAEEAGCTTGSLMHFYPNKRAILLAALGMVVSAVGQRYESARDAADLVGAIASVMPLDDLRRREWKVWLSYWGIAAFKPQVRTRSHALYEQNRAWVSDLLDIAIERGEIRRNIKRWAVVDHIIGLTDGIGIRATLDPNAWPAEAQIQRVRDYVDLLA